MSLLLDSLCGSQRLADCRENEASMLIVTHDSEGVEVVEVWGDEPAMEASE